MIFPDAQRLFYTKNTLSNVIVQFRFPPILDIETSVPSSFQNEINIHCPEYITKQIIQQQVNIGGNLNPMPTLQIQSPMLGKVHVFQNSRQGIAIELCSNSLTIALSQYQRWEKFQEIFLRAHKALEDIYSISYYTRIGLRYIDRFILSELGFRKGKKWCKLINPVFLGLATLDATQTIGFQNINEVLLGQYNAKATITTASLKRGGNNRIDGIVLDYDCNIESTTEIKDLQDKLDYLHLQSRNIFEYAVKKDLRIAMGVKTNDD